GRDPARRDDLFHGDPLGPKYLVDLVGIEPTTSSMPAASPGEPLTRKSRAPRLPWRSAGPEVFGGPGRDRTDDLFHAMEARSQLRHRPTLRKATCNSYSRLLMAVRSMSCVAALRVCTTSEFRR